jgi:hypothetical protein
MNVDILDGEDVERIALAKVCEYIKDDEWCEDGSVRMDIKNLNKAVGDLKHTLYQIEDAIKKALTKVTLEKEVQGKL